MGQIILAFVEIIALSSIDGRAVLVNPEQVTQLRETRPEGDPKKQLTGKVACVISLTDGSYVTVAEACNRVRELLEGKP
jgi:hypothetical protein